MSGNKVDFGITFKADGSIASVEINKVKQSIEGISGAAKTATTELGAHSTAVQKLGETEAQTAARIKEMVAASQAAQREMQGQADATTRARLSAAELDAAVMRSFPTRATERQLLDSVAESHARLAAAARAHAAELTATKTASVAALPVVVAGMDQAAGAAEKSMFATAGAKRELMVLGHEAMTGNFSRMPGSFMVLAERMSMTEALMNPMTLGLIAAGVAAATVAVEIYKGYSELDQLNKTMQLTGGYAGITRDSLDKTAASISTLSVTTGAAREVLTGFAATGKFTADELAGVGRAALEYQHLTGASADEAVKKFEGMADGVAAWAEKANASYHFLNVVQMEHIRTLEAEGNATQAIIEVTDAWHKSMDTSNEKVGLLKASYLGWALALGDVKEALLNLGKGQSSSDQIADAIAKENALRAKLASARQLPLGGGAAQIEESLQLQHKETLRLIEASNKAELDAYDKGEHARIQKVGEAAANYNRAADTARLSKQELFAREVEQIKKNAVDENAARIEAGGKATQTVEIINARIAAAQAKYADKPEAPDNTYIGQYNKLAEQLNKYIPQLDAERSGTAALTVAQKLAAEVKRTLTQADQAALAPLLAYARAREMALAEEQAVIDAAQAAYAAQIKRAEALQRTTEATTKDAERIREHTAEMGLSKEQVDLLRAARDGDLIALQEHQLAELDATGQCTAYSEALRENIKALNDRQAAQKGAAVKQDAVDAANASGKAWTEMWKTTDRVAHDAFMAWGEKGQSAAKVIGDALKKALLSAVYEASLKPIAFQIYGSVTSALGVPGASGGGSLLSTASNVSSAYTAGSTINAGYSAFAGSAVGQAAGLSTGYATATGTAAGAAPLWSGAVANAGTTAAGSTGAAMASQFAAAVPYLAAAVIAYQLISNATRGETRAGGRYALGTTDVYGTQGTDTANFREGPSGGKLSGVDTLVTQAYAGINQLLTNLGSAAHITGFQAGSETSDKGRGGVFSGGVLSSGARFGESGSGSNYNGGVFENTSAKSGDAATIAKNFSDDMLQVTIEAMQAATDLPKSVMEYLKGINAEALTADAATTTIVMASALSQLTKSMGDQGASAAVDALRANFGDLNKSLPTYLTATAAQKALTDSMQTDAEKLTAAQMALSAAGIPATVEGFKNMASALPLTTQAGQDMLAKMYELKPALDLVTQSTAEATVAVKTSAQIQAERNSAQVQLELLQGKYTQQQLDRFLALTDATDETTNSTLRLVYALQDQQATAAEAATTAAEAATTAAEAAALKTTNDNLRVTQYQIEGRSADALALQRKLETAGMDASTLAIKQRIYGLTDEKTASDAAAAANTASAAAAQAATEAAAPYAAAMRSMLNAAVSAAAGAVSDAERGVSTARAGIKAAYDRDLATLNGSTSTSAFKATSDRFAGIAKQFRDFGESLAGALDTPAQSFDRLKAEYARLSDMARLGDSAASSRAVSVGAALKDSIIAKSGTRIEADRELAKLTNAAILTAAIADTQVSVADAQLAALEDSNKIAKKALDDQVRSFGILEDKSQSIVDAIKEFASASLALGTASEAHLAAVQASLSNQTIKGANGTDYTLNEVSDHITSNVTDAASAYATVIDGVNNYGVNPVVTSGAASTIASTTPAGSESSTDATLVVAAAAKAALRLSDIKHYLTDVAADTTLNDQHKASKIYGEAVWYRATQAEAAAAYGWTLEKTRDWFADYGVPQFAQGTNLVPYDMTARIHEGEAIVPARFNPYNPTAPQSGSNGTAAALRALADRLDRIEANTRATAGHTAGTDRKLARVIPGNALITEAAV